MTRILSHALDDAVNESYQKALVQEKLSPVSAPAIKINQYPNYGETVEEIKNGFEYEAEFTVLPEITLGDYSKLKVDKPAKESVKPDDVQKILDNLQKQKAGFTIVDRPAKMSDLAEVNFDGSIKHVKIEGMASKHHPVVLGEKTLIPGFEDDSARYIEAVVKGMRVASVYVPNGMAVGSDKYLYKLKFLKHLYQHTKTLLTYEEALVLGGDFNVAPTDLDVYDPAEWLNQVLCTLPERESLRMLLNLGLNDALRALHPLEKELYTWWDYRGGAWQNNYGLRIDHLLLSPQAADCLHSAKVHKDLRDAEKASDHAPVVCSLKSLNGAKV